MITHGLSCDRVGFGHFVGGSPNPGYGLEQNGRTILLMRFSAFEMKQ